MADTFRKSNLIKKPKSLSNIRNERTQMVNKLKLYDEKFGLKTDMAKRAVACDYVIDCAKKKDLRDEPRMSD